MVKLIKSIISERIITIVHKIRWIVYSGSSSINRIEALGSLRCSVSYNKYGGFCVPLSSSHRPAARRILSHSVYEQKTIEFMLANCSSGDVVHAGTYFGDFLPALARGVADNAKVWAFEPNMENYRCARITLEINGIENVTLTHAGLGAASGIQKIKTTDGHGRSLGGASRIIPSESNDDLADTVRIVSVDEVVSADRDVSIIQLDVEGYEKEALSGALKTIRRCRPIIIVEVFPSSNFLESEWFSDKITDLGYGKIADIQGNSVFSCEQHD